MMHNQILYSAAAGLLSAIIIDLNGYVSHPKPNRKWDWKLMTARYALGFLSGASVALTQALQSQSK